MGNETTSESARQWHIVSRWHEYEGEARANLLRIAGIGVFYVIELLNYHGLRLGPIEIPAIVSKPLHQVITGLALAWALTGMAVLLCQKHQIFPAGLIGVAKRSVAATAEGVPLSRQQKIGVFFRWVGVTGIVLTIITVVVVVVIFVGLLIMCSNTNFH